MKGQDPRSDHHVGCLTTTGPGNNQYVQVLKKVHTLGRDCFPMVPSQNNQNILSDEKHAHFSFFDEKDTNRMCQNPCIYVFSIIKVYIYIYNDLLQFLSLVLNVFIHKFIPSFIFFPLK